MDWWERSGELQISKFRIYQGSGYLCQSRRDPWTGLEKILYSQFADPFHLPFLLLLLLNSILSDTKLPLARRRLMTLCHFQMLPLCSSSITCKTCLPLQMTWVLPLLSLWSITKSKISPSCYLWVLSAVGKLIHQLRLFTSRIKQLWLLQVEPFQRRQLSLTTSTLQRSSRVLSESFQSWSFLCGIGKEGRDGSEGEEIAKRIGFQKPLYHHSGLK